MTRLMIVCAGLLMLGLCVGAQEGPARSKPARLSLYFEDATLYEVMAKVAGDVGYKVIYARDVDPEISVSLDSASVSLEIACLLIEKYTDLDLIVTPARKLIEIRPKGARSAFTELFVIDTRKHQQAFMESRDSLGRRQDAEGAWHYASVDDATDALEFTMFVAFGYTTDYDYVTLNNEGLTAHTEARERDDINELFRLLLTEGGGRSRWLEAQTEAWNKLNAGVLSIEAEEIPLETVLQQASKQLGISVVVEADLKYLVQETTVSASYEKMPALDVLKLLFDDHDLKMVLLENLVYVIREDEFAFGISETGYAVYELDALVTERKATSKEESETLAWDIYESILDGLNVAIEGDSSYDVAAFGTKIVVRGDMCRQKAATDYLTALGWKAK